MARFLVAVLLVALPVVLSAPAEEKKGRNLALPGSGIAATGAVGANYGQQNAASETHDKKNFGLNYSSDRGSSNQYSNTGLQAAATGGIAQGVGYPSVYPQYPHYPYPVYPSYPVYPNYGVPSVGSGSSVQLPGVGAGSVAGVVPGQYPIRYY